MSVKRLLLLLIAVPFSQEDQPEFSVHPQNETKLEGDNATFTCDATGNSAPTFNWTKDGSILTAGSRISFSSDRKQLIITNVTREDSGQYVCEATNNVTTVLSNSATLNVQYAPGFTKHPDNIVKIEGETAIFNCTVDGNPEPSIDWTKDNVTLNITADPDLSQSNSGKVHSLEIKNIYRSDKGQYRCVANNNSIGSATSLAGTLSVHYAPGFTKHPDNIVKIEGETAIFNCTVDGNPEPSIDWTKDNVTLNITADPDLSQSNSGKVHSLEIKNIYRSDKGQYRCVANNNSIGSATSLAGTLSVHYAPGFTKHPDNIVKIEGETAIFNCTVDGNPEPSIDWTKDNVTLNITADPDLSQLNSGKVHSLEIKNIYRSDKGQYRCVANNNSIGSATSLAGTLSVHYAPGFTKHPDNIVKIEGETAIFNCTVDGNPEPSIDWTKDNVTLNITADPDLIESNSGKVHSLTIQNVHRSDEGQYRCVANNSIGSATSEAGSLSVHFAPEVTIDGAAQQLVVIGNKVQLTCHYNTSPPVSEVRWEKDGTVISKNDSVENGSRGNITHFNGSTVQLTIVPSILSDSGNYTCVVRNIIETSSANASVIIQVVPSPPQNVEIIANTSRVVNISWTPGFNGNSAIRNYTVEIRTDNQAFEEARCEGLSSSGCVVSFTSASLVDLHPGTTYYIRVFATNKVGSSNVSLVLRVNTDEEAPNAAPSNVVGNNASSTSILVQWGNVPSENQNGIIGSYTVSYTARPNGSEQTKVVNTPANGTTLTGLNEFTNYSITVFASTSKGGGNVSEPIIVITDEDKPNAPPANVRGQNASSTNILVQWGDVPAADQNGIILGYTVTYTALPGGSPLTKEVDAPITQANLTGLNKYTNYSITVSASTSKGGGNASVPIIVITDEDKPTDSPQNVRGRNTSSTSIFVEWDNVPEAGQNGIILSYKVEYKVFPDGNPQTKVVDAPTTQANLTGLNEYTQYIIFVVASTRKGSGPDSDNVDIFTDEDKPNAPPENVRGRNTSSTSILVQWDDVSKPDQNGIILSYTVTYKTFPDGTPKTEVVDTPTKQVTLTGLKKYTNYSITVFASTVKGDGNVSEPIIVITDEDTPNAAPSNVTGNNASSTSILVQWGNVPSENQNGIILSYTVTYKALPGGSPLTKVVNAQANKTTLTGLNEYTNYSITVFASTSKGGGNATKPIIVITDEDEPNAPPENVRGRNTSSTSILVQWDDVPQRDQNGIILNYTVTYKTLPGGTTKSEVVDTPTKQVTLTGLNEYTNYSITVFASTVKGSGNVSEPIIVITDEDKPTAPPSDVQGHITSPTSILVEWGVVPAADQNGIILRYTVKYTALPGDSEQTRVVNAPTTEATLMGLNEHSNYTITVFASTVKGDGNVGKPITLRTDEDRPSKSPEITSVTVLDTTSVLLKWEPVPRASQNGIIRNYTIHFRDVEKKENGAVTVRAPAVNAIVNGLRQKAEYLFWIVAATSVGYGPSSVSKTATTKAVPTKSPPQENTIGTNEVKVPFVNKATLSSGKPVTHFQIIVTPLKGKEDDPGNSADPKYETVDLTYETQEQGKPYITAEFGKGRFTTEFPVGDGKYYSRNGETDSKRKRRAAVEEYLNGKLDDNTKYAVFQRSFDKDDNYESEGFIVFTTNKDNTSAVVAGVVVPLIVVAVIVVVVVFYIRRRNRNKAADGEDMPMNSKPPRTTRTKLEIRKSQDLAKDFGGTASKAERKICKSKNLLLEVPPELVTIMEELGRGAFGRVYKSVMRGLPEKMTSSKRKDHSLDLHEGRIVATKVLRENATEQDKRQLVQEIELMKEVGTHPNIVSMLGYWIQSPPIVLIMEYVPNGDLLQWLRNKRQQLTTKKSRQSDVVERLKPPVPERPKLVSRNLQTKDFLDENLKEENRERNNEESGKDGGYHSSETKEIKIDLDDDERGILFYDAPRSEMGPLCSNLEDEDEKEEEASGYVNKSFLQNEGREGPVTSVMMLPSISIAHFSKEKELTLAEPLRNVEEKITIEKEEGSCEGKEDDEEDISGEEVLCYAWQIAKGMEYLASKGFIHRDLAARNILLGEDRAVKISDFGLLRHANESGIYEVTSVNKLPVKWMAPEALESGIFTFKTDVWSFGVVLWELVTMGGTPYPRITHMRLRSLLKSGYRMEKPNTCSDEIYKLMMDCWKEDPNERPSFVQLIPILEEMMTEDTPYCSFRLLDQNQPCYREASATNTSITSTLDTKL